MMIGFGGRRGASRGGGSWSRRWSLVAIIAAVVLFAGLLVVNIAGQGFEQQPFTSPSFNASSGSFPAGILRGSLTDTPSCDPKTIRRGDGTCAKPYYLWTSRANLAVVFRSNHSMFAYKVVDTGQTDIQYQNSPLSNCWVEEILVRITKDLDSILPADFGFFPKAEVLSIANSLMESV